MKSQRKVFLIAAILGFMIGATIVLYQKNGIQFLQNKAIAIGLAATIFGLILLFLKTVRGD